MAPSIVHFPEMALTLVRRTSAKLPFNHFLFRTEVHWTKAEIREYLEKVYSVKVARIATAISRGKIRRVTGKRSLYKLKDFKKVYVRIEDEKTVIAAPAVVEAASSAAASSSKAAELR